MDGWLTLIFGKSETSGDINTIISPFVYLWKIWLLTKYGGCGFEVFNWINTKISAFVYLYVRNLNPEGKDKINGFPAKNVLKMNWAWQAYFLSHTLHILWEVISFKEKQMVKLWFWYLPWFKIYRKSVWVFHPCL